MEYDTPTAPATAASNLSVIALSRRKNYERTCRFVATHRNGRLREIPLDQLIPLAFHTVSTILDHCRDINAVVQDACRQYKNDQSDLFSDWQKYCNALTGPQRIEATYEGAIIFAAQGIPVSSERDSWMSACLPNLDSLKQLTGIKECDGRRSKRKRGTGQEGQPNATEGFNGVIQARPIETTEVRRDVNDLAGNALSPVSTLSQLSTGITYQGEAVKDASPTATDPKAAPHAQTANQVLPSGTKVASIAVLAKLVRILGHYLFKGMEASHMRSREEARRWMTFTDAVRLHLAQPRKDFVLEVWLSSPIGNAISQVRLVDDLRGILGDYLFAAMEASNRRKEEKRTGMLTCTNAVNVSFPSGGHSGEDNSEDSMLEIMLNFETGRNIYAEAYLATISEPI